MSRFLSLQPEDPPTSEAPSDSCEVDNIHFSSIHDEQSPESASDEGESDPEYEPPLIRRFNDHLSMNNVDRYKPVFPENHWLSKATTGCFPQNPDLPFWKETQRQILSWSAGNEEHETSPEVEESNQMIYMTGLVDAMVTEARWRSRIAANPKLATCLSAISPEYADGLVSATENGHDSGDSDTSTLVDPDEDVEERIVENGTFYVKNKQKQTSRRIRSNTRGVAEVVLKRDHELTPADFAVQALESLMETVQIPDRHVQKWVDDVIGAPEKLLMGERDPLSKMSTSSAGDVWIVRLHVEKSSKDLLEEQNYRCAGCETKITDEYVKRVKYCDYFGKMFCQCCHQGARAKIPARILATWCFKEFMVSDKALSFLNEVYKQPAIHLKDLAPKLIEKIRVLRNALLMREKLSHIWSFVQFCPDAVGVITKEGRLESMFLILEKHYLGKETDLFSLEDLERVHNGKLSALLEPAIHYGKAHIEKCEKCLLQATFCPICNNEKDPLFPHQVERVARCEKCGTLTHLKCEARRKHSDEGCVKCIRNQEARRRRIVRVYDELSP
ncbi:unnamed protein product, partial [Mesorhabditis spiculigera]